MPSIAAFIKELLSEDKYSSDYSDRILERVTVMNAAQLQGIYNHLQVTAKTSKCNLWMEANIELMSRIEGILKERTAEQLKINKIIEEDALKEQQKIKKVIENNKEKKRVMRMIVENARTIAIQEVKENEMKRQADEKLEIIQKVFQGEERRNKWWKISAISFVISIVLICIFIKNIYFLLAGIVFVIIIISIAVYKAYQFTNVVPRIVDESELELEITKKEEVLKKKAVSILQEKERKFQEQLIKDKKEKHKRKLLKRNSILFEQRLMLNRSKTQKDMAKDAAAFHIIYNNSIGNNDSFIIHNIMDEDDDDTHVVDVKNDDNSLYAEAKTYNESSSYLENIEDYEINQNNEKEEKEIIKLYEESMNEAMMNINQNNNDNNINIKYNTTNESLESNDNSIDIEIYTNDIEKNLMDK